MLFLAYTGTRPGEAFALDWRDIDLERDRISVRRRLYKGDTDLPKSNRVRECVLTPPARDALLTLQGRSGPVFTGERGGRYSQSLLTGYCGRQPPACSAPVASPRMSCGTSRRITCLCGLACRSE